MQAKNVLPLREQIREKPAQRLFPYANMLYNGGLEIKEPYRTWSCDDFNTFQAKAGRGQGDVFLAWRLELVVRVWRHYLNGDDNARKEDLELLRQVGTLPETEQVVGLFLWRDWSSRGSWWHPI